MNELLKDMGQRILDRRKQLNMTQETLANLTHLTSQTISYADTGQKKMRPETVNSAHSTTLARSFSHGVTGF